MWTMLWMSGAEFVVEQRDYDLNVIIVEEKIGSRKTHESS